MAAQAGNPHWSGDGTPEPVGDLASGEHWLRVPIRALDIVWGNDPRFWRLDYMRDGDYGLNGFKDGALLVQVNWIQVTGKVRMDNIRRTSSVKKYEIYYVVSFREDAFGWHSAPIKFKVRDGTGKKEIPSMNLEEYRKVHDTWHEIPGGQFSVSDTAESVEFGMYEVETAWWKGSMILAGVKIKPAKDDVDITVQVEH